MYQGTMSNKDMSIHSMLIRAGEYCGNKKSLSVIIMTITCICFHVSARAYFTSILPLTWIRWWGSWINSV